MNDRISSAIDYHRPQAGIDIIVRHIKGFETSMYYGDMIQVIWL